MLFNASGFSANFPSGFNQFTSQFQNRRLSRIPPWGWERNLEFDHRELIGARSGSSLGGSIQGPSAIHPESPAFVELAEQCPELIEGPQPASYVRQQVSLIFCASRPATIPTSLRRFAPVGLVDSSGMTNPRDDSVTIHDKCSRNAVLPPRGRHPVLGHRSFIRHLPLLEPGRWQRDSPFSSPISSTNFPTRSWVLFPRRKHQ